MTKKTKNKNSRKLLTYLFVLSGIVMVVLFFRQMRIWEQARSTHPYSSESGSDWYETHYSKMELVYDGKTYTYKDGLETILLMGIDKDSNQAFREDSYRNNGQSDFLMLLIIDKKSQKCTALQIDRDTMAQIPILSIDGEQAGYTTGQLALSHTFGSGGKDSCKNTVDSVSHLLFGFPIDHYLSVTLEAVPKLNDAAGGVTVTVTDDFSGVDDSLKMGETITLDGEQALTYVRSRKQIADGTNIHRMSRQKEYMQSLFSTIDQKSAEDASVLAECLAAVSPYMVTDCTSEKLTSMADMVLKYDVSEILSIPGESQMGEKFVEFYADEDQLKKLIIDNYFDEK